MKSFTATRRQVSRGRHIPPGEPDVHTAEGRRPAGPWLEVRLLRLHAAATAFRLKQHVLSFETVDESILDGGAGS